LATYLADTSALVRLHHDDVASRVEPLFLGGRVATCGIVDLELLATARTGPVHREIWGERQLLPRARIDEACLVRAIEVQAGLADHGQHQQVPIGALIIAAAAEREGLTILHYDDHFELIAAVTGQAAEWVVPRGRVP
jgi:predicted nucleic acid-binding protein